MTITQAIAFAGPCRIALGAPADVAVAAKRALDGGETSPILIFDAVTGRPIDLPPAQTDAELRAAFAPSTEENAVGEPKRGRGRPKLGVVAREVTLLPRHWDWLSAQRGGASAALRRLVDEARREGATADALRQAREALYRFITAMAGDAPAYEEATRALFAGDEAHFIALTGPWPTDIRAHALTLARPAFGHTPSPLDALIPPDRRAAVDRALASAFPGAVVEAAERMAWGASGAGVFKIIAAGRSALLRVEGPPAPHNDAARHYACLKIAAEVGVAPPLIYADADDRVALIGFIEPVAADPPLSRAAMLAAAASTIARLHAAAPFLKVAAYLDIMDGIVGQFRASGALPPGALDETWVLYDRVAAAYPRDKADIVSSHNDLNPSNIIFQGFRPWFVDWEAASAMDRYVDLAALANFFAADETDEVLILTTYFGQAPDERQRARFYLMQQVNRLFYGIMLVNAAVAERPQMRLTADDLAAPRLAEVRREMANLATFDGRLRFGCVFLGEALQGMRSERFEAALEVWRRAEPSPLDI